MHRYPHLAGTDLRHTLAERHGVEPGRLILGNGAAELLSAATRALLEPGQQLLTLWPSYPLYPIMARRAHGQAVRVSGGVDELLSAAREPAVRAIVLASPNDPTGELLPVRRARAAARRPARRRGGAARRGAGGVRRRPADERLAGAAGAQPRGCSCSGASPRPGAWPGLRIGYAIGGPGSEDLLAELDPDLGVSELSQAGALEALRTCSELIAAAREGRSAASARALTGALRERGFDVSDSQANFVWAAHPAITGARAVGAARPGRDPRRRRRRARRARAGARRRALRRGRRSPAERDRQGALATPGRAGRRLSRLSRPGAAARRWCPRGSSARRCWTRSAGRSVRRPCARA